MSDFMSYLFAILVVTPLQEEVDKRLGAMDSENAAKSVSACLSSGVPSIVAQAQSDWGWAAWTMANVSVGMVPVESLLEKRGPECRRLAALLWSAEEAAKTGRGDKGNR